jgi:hypothetical protein
VVQCPHDPDRRQHRRPALRRDQDQGLHRGSPFRRLVGLRKLRDVVAGILESDELAPVRQLDWVVKFAAPAGNQSGTGGTAQQSPLYPGIGSRHEFMEMIDAPTNARLYRVTDRGVIVISSGPYGHPAGATGVHARRTAILPEAVGRRQCGSAMFAAKSHEAEQELPEGIPEPRNVN